MFNLAQIQKIYIAVGYSDLRRGIDGFASMIQNTFHMCSNADHAAGTIHLQLIRSADIHG